MQSNVESFIARWQNQEGGQERANYALFLTELCDLLELPHADPASAAHETNDYVFERVVRETARDGSFSSRRIDLYKRDCFILEAKQSRLSGDKKLDEAPRLPGIATSAPRGRRAGLRYGGRIGPHMSHRHCATDPTRKNGPSAPLRR